MISIVLYGADCRFLLAIGRLLRRGLAQRTSEECQMLLCESLKQLEEAVEAKSVWDVACVDVGDGGAVSRAREVRTLCPQVELLIVVDANASPMRYVRPGVIPSALVQRETSVEQVRSAIEDFVGYLVEMRGSAGDEHRFVIETKEGVASLPFQSILCFESRAKRITVRLKREEYAYYDTLDHLQDTLPRAFLRCHRSYIVNIDRVRRLRLSDNTIELDDGTLVPVSRSYKSAIKEGLRTCSNTVQSRRAMWPQCSWNSRVTSCCPLPPTAG